MQKLQAHLQTRKISSLPEDLRNIAEELLIEKFGRDDVIEEVKAEKSADTFPGFNEYSVSSYSVGIDMGRESVTTIDERFTSSTTATEAMVAATRHEPGVDRRIDLHTRSSYFVTPITRADTRAFRDAIQRLDYENAPKRKRRAQVSPGYARELLSHPDFRYFAGYIDDRYRGYNYGNYVGKLFGVPIFAVEGVHPEIIAE